MTTTTAPTWSPVEEDVADLLSVLANDGTAQREQQYAAFVGILRHVAKWNGGVVSPNETRVHTRVEVAPQRVGPFFRRAQLEGLLEVDGWDISDDRAGKNSGKPCRKFRWTGGDLS